MYAAIVLLLGIVYLKNLYSYFSAFLGHLSYILLLKSSYLYCRGNEIISLFFFGEHSMYVPSSSGLVSSSRRKLYTHHNLIEKSLLFDTKHFVPSEHILDIQWSGLLCSSKTDFF